MGKIFDTLKNQEAGPNQTSLDWMSPKPTPKVEAEPVDTYEVINEQQTAFLRMDGLQKKGREIEASTLPEEEKEVLYEELQKDYERVISQGTQPLEMSWIDYAEALAGPAGFTKFAGKTFGKLTLGLLTGSQRLSGKSAVKAFTASLAIEAPLGQTLDILEEAMPVDMPWYLRAPIMFSANIGIGGFSQAKVENSITAVANHIRKQGVNVPASTVKDATVNAQKLLDEELALTGTVNRIKENQKLSKKEQRKRAKKQYKNATASQKKALVDSDITITQKGKKRDLTDEFKVPKGKDKKKTGKQRAQETKDSQTPIFEDEIPVDTVKNYADLDTVKENAIGIFPDSYIEAEHVSEFFDSSGPLVRKLVAQLKSKGLEGVSQPAGAIEGIDSDYARKFFVNLIEETPETLKDKKREALINMLTQANRHAGANTVTGMTGGMFAGIELDEEGNVVGYNVSRAIAVTAALAIGVGGYSKFIAGIKGMKALPTEMKANKEFQLSVAKKLEAINQPMDKIGLRTGWYVPSGQVGWREYVPDKEMVPVIPMARFTQMSKPVQLEDFMTHPEMTNYYGNSVMRNTRIVFDRNTGTGAYDPVEDLIIMGPGSIGKTSKLKKIVMHEVQHAIQNYEGHSPGTNSSMMDSIVFSAVDILKTPKAERTIEAQQFLDEWIESARTLPKTTQAEIQKQLTAVTKAWAVKNTNKAEAALVKLANAYSPEAYRNAYGEVEARAIEKAYDTGAISIKDLSKPGYIDAEKLIVSMWNNVSNHPSKEALDSMSHLASRMNAEGVDQGVFKRWEDYSNNKIIEPIKHWVDSQIYSQRMRKAFGIDLPKKFRELKADYDRRANRTLDETMAIAKKLNELAPTQKEQKRLMQVLRGGVTANPELASAAREVQELFTDLRKVSLDAGLRNYDVYDALTKTERNNLKMVIRLSNNPKKVLAAQDALKAHYTAGTSYEYVPTFLKSEEGVTGAHRKALIKKLNKLKAIARRSTELNDDEPLPHIRDEISEIEDILAINRDNAFNTERKQLTKGYTNVTLPEEASRLLNTTQDGINSASFTASRGLSEQAIDIQRLSFLDAIKDNPLWVLEKGIDPELVPAHFRKLAGEKYGSLNGLYVDRVIADDIDDMGEVTNSFIRNWDKILGLWKLGKAVWNPATHVGNTTSNIFLAHLGGVSPLDMKTYGQAAQALQLRMGNKWFREAEGWGLMNNTFSAAELSQFRKSLSSFREHPKTVTTGQKVKDTLANWMSKPAALYEGNEQMFKMAVFIKARKDGLDIHDSATKAEEYLFNYRDIPPIVRHYKRWASPFFTFTYKASGLMAKEIIRHPHKLAAWGALYLGLQKVAEELTGTKPGEVSKDRANMPGGGPFNMLLPWRDIDGNRQYFDIGRLIPIGQYEQKWGQTGLPLGSFAPTANPLTSVAYEIAINKDLFTGREIIDNSLDDLMAKMGKWGLHVYREMTPSLAPGNYSYNNLRKGLRSLDKDVVDYTGQEVTMYDMVARSIFGFKVSSATKQAMFRSFRSEVMKIDRGIGKRLNQARTKLTRNEISREEYDEVSGKLIRQKRFLKDRIYDRMKGE